MLWVDVKFNGLYKLIEVNQKKDLSIGELQSLNLQVLSEVNKYYELITVEEIKSILMLSIKYWSDLSENVNLEDIKTLSWALNDKLFPNSMLDSPNEIILRIIISTTYDDKDKENVEQTIDFLIFLFEKLKQYLLKQKI